MTLGVDPHVSKPYGYAIVGYDGLHVHGTCDLWGLWTLMRLWNLDLVAVEDQYLNRNYKTAKGLSWSAGKVMGLAEILKVPYHEVNVATWKSRMKVTGGRHVQAVADRYSLRASDDEASAILIAQFAEDERVKLL